MPSEPDATHGSVAPTRLLFRKIVAGSSLYSLAIVGSTLASIVLLPINTRYLTRSDIGVLDLLEKISIAVSYLLGLNFSSAFGYFYFNRPSAEERSPVVGTMSAGSAIMGIFAGGLSWILAAPLSRLVFASPDYAQYLRVIFLLMPLSFLLEAGMGWLRVEDRAPAFVAVSFLRIAITICGTVVAVAVLRLRVWGVLTVNLTAIAVLAVVVTVYCFRHYRFVFEWPLFVKILKFAVPLGLSGVAMFIIHFGDRFIIPHYHPLGDLGIYSIAYKIGMLISVVFSAFQTYWNAQVYQIAKREDANAVIGRTFSYMILILSLCLVGLIVTAKPALQILTTRTYWEAALLVPVIVAAYFVRAIGDFFRCVFLVEGRPGYDAACNWIGAGVCLISYFALIPQWGIWGAAFATLITFTVIGVVSVIWAQRLKPFRVEVGRLTKIFLAAGLPLGAYFLVPVSSLPVEIAWSALLLLAYPLLLTILRFPTPGEWGLVRSAVEKTRRAVGLVGP